MTIESNKIISEGKSLWAEYVKVNGYAFYPNNNGIEKLARLLDLNKTYIKKCITSYLES